MISAMLWSMSSTPASCSSRTDRTAAAKAGTSDSGSPAAGSSSSTKRGSVASARATPSRRSSPCASEPAGASRVAPQAEQVEQLGGACGRPARPDADAERRDLDVLAHRERRERVRVLERPRETGAAAAVRGPAGDVSALELDPALRRPVEAAQDVHERRLAGAVRADQADDLAPPQLERDLAQRLHALERARHRGGPERCSGPPIGLGSCRGQAVLDVRDDLGDDRADDPRDVVLDLDHAVLPPEHRVQLRARSSRARTTSAPS